VRPPSPRRRRSPVIRINGEGEVVKPKRWSPAAMWSWWNGYLTANIRRAAGLKDVRPFGGPPARLVVRRSRNGRIRLEKSFPGSGFYQVHERKAGRWERVGVVCVSAFERITGLAVDAAGERFQVDVKMEA